MKVKVTCLYKMLKFWKNRILKIELKINSISLNNENNEQIYCQNKKLKFEIKIIK